MTRKKIYLFNETFINIDRVSMISFIKSVKDEQGNEYKEFFVIEGGTKFWFDSKDDPEDELNFIKQYNEMLNIFKTTK